MSSYWQPPSQRRPPRMSDDELLIALSFLRTGMSELARLHGGIVRRGIAPPGWSETFMNSLLEMRCAVQLLKQQIEAHWTPTERD